MTLNSSGDIANYGSLYTGSQMVLNAGHTIRNYRNAAMDSDGSITATGDKFVNNSNVNAKGNITITRSEEHTSELQSLMRISYAVFCLKKTQKNNKYTEHTK